MRGHRRRLWPQPQQHAVAVIRDPQLARIVLAQPTGEPGRFGPAAHGPSSTRGLPAGQRVVRYELRNAVPALR